MVIPLSRKDHHPLMPKKVKRNTSRLATPWDNQVDISPLQGFIQSRYQEAYFDRHPEIANSKEVELLNSYSIENCKHCNSSNIKKSGYTKIGLRRYKCKDCNRTFSIITNTIFENRKISISEWIEFCLDVFRYESLSVTSKTNKNASTTTKYWLKKLFMLLEDYQTNIILSGNVFIDETFFPVAESDKVKTKDDKELRGLSINQFCIAVGYDGKNVFATLEGMGKPSSPRALQAYEKHIEKGSHLIHDKEKSHRVLIQKLELTEETYDSRDCLRMSDKENPLNPINQMCNRLKQFLRSHSGFNRDDLQDYLNLFCFIMNPPRTKLEKVEILLTSAISSAKTLKYREYYKSKSQ